MRKTASAAWLTPNGTPTDVSFTSYSYDVAGRLAGNTQTTGGNPYPFVYTWYNDDQLASIQYPSNRTVTTCYDHNQRVTWVDATLTPAACIGGGSASSNAYAKVQSYWPQGAINQMTLGNGLLEQDGFNNRLQMVSKAATVAGVSRLGLALTWTNCPPPMTSCTPRNNGNLLAQSIGYASTTLEPGGLSVTQNYSYDGVNRLTLFAEGANTQTQNYDGFGNRWVSSTMPLSNLTPQYQTTYLPAGGAAPTNQMLGNGYDASGNQRTLDPFTLTYDAENRVVSAAAPSPVSVTESYAYDGEGRRVQKTGTTSTVFVYDGFGNLAAEYGQAGSASGTQYLTTDHLGSTRLVTDANGNVVARYDYLPFGEGIAAGLGGRSSFYSIGAFPVSADGLSVKFTGKERDAETGLDYFGARYFSSAQGRWTGPDWSATPQAVPYGDLKDPQTLNLYVYVRNSPLSKADPDGHCGIIGDYPCSLGEFIASVPDRAVGGLKGLSNLLLRTHLEPSNDEQADAMETTRRDGPTIVGYGAMVLPGPKGLKEVPVEPYEVGTFSDLKSRSSVGDQLDIHHVGQQNPMRQTVSDYDPNTAPSIALPEAEHQAIPRQRGAVKLSPRDQLAKDARDLRSVGVPNKQIQKVIELNKQKYPEMKK